MQKGQALATAVHSYHRLDVDGRVVAFTASEPGTGTDLNGDGDALDQNVVHYHDADADTLVNLGVTAEYVHGNTGIDGAEFTEPTTPPADGHAVDFIIDTLMSTDGVTLCTLGPLTNVGMALDREPAIAARIEQLVLMGGGFFEGGNTTPAAEFNIYVDPHAAATVFASGIPLVQMPLDVTHKALTSDLRVEAFRELGNQAGRAVAGMLEFYERYDMERYGTQGAPLHDPCVIAYLLEPDLFAGRECYVEVETLSELTMGMTVVDWWRLTDQEPNCLVMNEVDDERFFALLTERIGRLP